MPFFWFSVLWTLGPSLWVWPFPWPLCIPQTWSTIGILLWNPTQCWWRVCCTCVHADYVSIVLQRFDWFDMHVPSMTSPPCSEQLSDYSPMSIPSRNDSPAMHESLRDDTVKAVFSNCSWVLNMWTEFSMLTPCWCHQSSSVSPD